MAVSLLTLTALWARWLALDLNPYHWLHQTFHFLGERESALLSAMLAYILLFVLWIFPTFALRRYADMPPMGTEQPAPRDAFRQIQHGLKAQHALRAEMLAEPAYEPSRIAYFRRMGWIGIIVGGFSFLLTWMLWFATAEVWITPLAVGLVSVLGGSLSVITGKPFLFDTPKIHALAAFTRRCTVIFLICAMLFLAIMCILTAAGVVK